VSLDLCSAGNLPWREPSRTLHIDNNGLRYHAPDQDADIAWQDVQAIVAAGVEVPGDDAVPALGIVLRLPFPQPVLVDGPGPNLDYAFPLAELGRKPLLGLHVAPEEIMAAAAGFARQAGVAVISSHPSEGWSEPQGG